MPAVPLSATSVEREGELIEAALAERRNRIFGPSGATAKLGFRARHSNRRFSTHKDGSMLTF
jgi:hypothetical protein